ncbi:MAG: hypothetical protein IJD92_00515 [Bacilli bacterium]|nr:hypothetical protein [Bacilli bacterium]
MECLKRKKLQDIETARKKLEEEKQELLFIKEYLEDKSPKIDISNIYVWEDAGVYSIVQLEVQKIRGKDWIGIETDGYLSTLIDIFTNNVVYQKSNLEKIKRKEFISGENLYDGYYAHLISLYEVDRNLLAYADKKVPLYVLQKLYYRLNNVDLKSYALKK